jgi:hypothetical protein
LVIGNETRRDRAKLSAKKCHPAQRSAVGDAPTSNRGVVSTENSRIEPVVGSLMKFPEKMTAAFKELEKEHQLKDLSVEIVPTDSYRFLAIVRSESFEKIPDYARQDLVWGKVLERFDDSEQRRIEFIDSSARSDMGDEAYSTAPLKKRKKPAKRR